MNERFTIKPERPERPPSVTEEGVVSGEIGHVEPVEAEAEPTEAERLQRIEAAARQDGMLSQIFDDVVMEDPRQRAAAILERINLLRRELDRSDLDPAIKNHRDQWLS